MENEKIVDFLIKNKLFTDDNIISVLLKNEKGKIKITSIIVNKRKTKVEDEQNIKYSEIHFEEVSKKDLDNATILFDKICFVKKVQDLYKSLSFSDLKKIIDENNLNIRKK